MPASAPGIGDLLADWQPDAGVLVLIAVTGVLYVGATLRLDGTRWPVVRTAAFLAGLALLALSLQSGLDTYAGDLLSVHMAQHLVLTMGAAALLVAAAPVTLILRTLHGRPRRRLAAALRHPVIRFLTHPVFTWSLFAAVLLVSHLPAVYDLALREPLVHHAEHAAYLWTAILFWVPVIGADPLPHRLSMTGSVAYLLLSMIPMSIVGAGLIVAGDVAYPQYAGVARDLGVSALDDQRLGGSIMWVGGTVMLVATTLLIAWRALMREERRQRARDAYEDRRAAETRTPASLREVAP